MSASQPHGSPDKAPLTPRMKAGKKLFASAQRDLREAQRHLDLARALRRGARPS